MKSALEINVIIHLGGLDIEGVSLLRRKGYRIAKFLRDLTRDPQQVSISTPIEIYIDEDLESQSYPRLTIEMQIATEGLSDATIFNIKRLARQIRRDVTEKLQEDVNFLIRGLS